MWLLIEFRNQTLIIYVTIIQVFPQWIRQYFDRQVILPGQDQSFNFDIMDGIFGYSVVGIIFHSIVLSLVDWSKQSFRNRRWPRISRQAVEQPRISRQAAEQCVGVLKRRFLFMQYVYEAILEITIGSLLSFPVYSIIASAVMMSHSFGIEMFQWDQASTITGYTLLFVKQWFIAL